MFCAVEGNKLDNLKQLLSRGLDCTTKNWRDENLLHMASLHGDVDMVQYLVLKLDPNSCDHDEETPLHKAVKANPKLAVVEILVANGASISAKNIKGQTMLHLSARPINPMLSIKEAMKYLISQRLGVNDRDKNGNTPLHLCRTRKAKECLVELGADINIKNINGEIPAKLNPILWEDLP